jgi:hypothetical protein
MIDLHVVPQETIDPWEAFWTLYPRRQARKDAQRAWTRIQSSEHAMILESLVAWRNVWRQQNTATHHIPLPATWLNGERYRDEVPPELQVRTVVIPGKPIEQAARGTIPLSVQKVLDEMKKRRST